MWSRLRLYVLVGLTMYMLVGLNFSNRYLQSHRKWTGKDQFISNDTDRLKEYFQYDGDNTIVFLVITGKPHQDYRIPLQQQTWMKHTTQTFSFSETASQQLPLIVLPNITDSYASNGPKFWDALHWAWEKFQHRTKWFAKIDDDTFVNIPEIVALLKKKDATKFKVVGRCGECLLAKSHISKQVLSKKWTFVDGGAGIFISEYTMSLLYSYGFLNKYKVLKRLGPDLYGTQDAAFGEIITEIERREALRNGRTFISPFDCENELLHHGCSPNRTATKFCLTHTCATLHRCRNELMSFWYYHFYINNSNKQN